MSPTLRAGDIVLLDPRAYATALPRDLDLIVLEHPRRAGLRIVKRVEFTNDRGELYVVSDNATEPNTQDSRTFGTVPISLVEGRVTAKIR